MLVIVSSSSPVQCRCIVFGKSWSVRRHQSERQLSLAGRAFHSSERLHHKQNEDNGDEAIHTGLGMLQLCGGGLLVFVGCSASSCSTSAIMHGCRIIADDGAPISCQ